MRKLAIETSTDVCSVALQTESDTIIEKRTEKRGSHSEKLFLFVEELMGEQSFRIDELDVVLVSEGPGSYTGLRISASAVKGLLYHSGVRLIGVNTLASFAMAACREMAGLKTIHSIIDARRVHVYHRKFEVEKGGLSSPGTVGVIPIERFQKMIRSGEAVIGTGIERLDSEILKQVHVFGSEYISACSLFYLCQTEVNAAFCREVSPQEFEPQYYTSRQVESK